jgi:Flp pilus assembly protein protease CpaA
MEWFSRKTSIAGIQISNWMVVLGAVIVILVIYISMQEVQIPH